MPVLRTIKKCLLAAGSVVLLTVTVLSIAQAGRGEWGTVQEPLFGDVLYEFHKQNYFSAITHLSAYTSTNRLAHHQAHGEILLGGMYVSYGMPDRAERLFESLIKAGVSPEVHDRAWFFLGKVRYQRGYYKEAEEALRKVKDRLPAELKEEHLVLLANLLIERQAYDEAIKLLDKLGGESFWTQYGRYNLGVAMIKAGQESAGRALLEQVGSLKLNDAEMKALRDKANLALGYSYLQKQEADEASRYLQRVRLTGLLSNKALLGMGWAWSAKEDYRKALVFWLELHKRDIINAAVQESLLAVPYALGKLGAYQEALQKYREAIAVFETEMQRLGYAIEAIRAGKLDDKLLALDPRSEVGWFAAIRNLPDAPESRYLVHLLASHSFQEVLKNYRDVRFLQSRIKTWHGDTRVYDQIIGDLKKSYYARLPRIRRNYQSLDAGSLNSRYAHLKATIARAEQHEDVRVFATSQEQQQLEMLDKLDARLRAIEKQPGGVEVAEVARNKHRLLRGALVWKLHDEFAPRLWQVNKGLRDIQAGLGDSNEGKRGLNRVAREVPWKLDRQSENLAAIRNKLAQAVGKADNLERALSKHLQQVAISGLQIQRERLGTYLTQARFGTAQIIDKALERGEAGQ